MELERFLVCGLGSLGQHCVVSLKEFGVTVIAIDQIQPQTLDIPNLLDLLDELIIGDCRQNSILEQAKIQHCRAVLLVTTSEQVNAETALAIRQLNPQTRLVVRSAKANLNQLLSEQLGNLIAYEPTELPANAFALAALGTETLGFFNLEGQWLRVIQSCVSSTNPWSYNRSLHELKTRTRQILAHAHAQNILPKAFYQWQPQETILPGDKLVYIETADQFFLNITHSPQPSSLPSRTQKNARWISQITRPYQRFCQKFSQFWQFNLQQQVRRLALICTLIVMVLLLFGTIIFQGYYPGTTWLSSFFATAILMLGGYGDLFGNFQEDDTISPWLQAFALILNLAGTAFVGVLYALLTEMLLSAKFQFAKQRPPIPPQDHIIIIGLGRVGQRVAIFLQQLKQVIVGINFNMDLNEAILPNIPIITGTLTEALKQANLGTAKSVVIVTDDEILNLEAALMTKSLNPQSHLVIRTSGQRLSQHLMSVLPASQVLGMYGVAAEVFAGSAFGENIIDLFRFNHQTILVTEYEIEARDTLQGLLLAEVAYGYQVVPILHQRPPNPSTLMPTDDILLTIGDRLVVLATIAGLRSIEVGQRQQARWQVQVKRVINSEAAFEGANTISRVSGCPLNLARELMNNLPGILSQPLYQHQAERLIRALSKLQISADLISPG